MKERLDVILVNQGYAPSREKAKAIIMSGNVYVNGQKEDKAGSQFDESKIQLEVRGSQLKYVSRGGLKLEKAMESWNISLEGFVCMDIGASTGGFTDCMLQNGAVKVYSVDVGHGQLAWKLRNDERVVCMEKTNFRHMVPSDIADRLDFASVDVSFISLTKILIPARNLLKDGGQMVCLIKPQFEAGREKVGKKGVVRERSVHEEVVRKVLDYADSIGFELLNLEFSPIKGPEGNIEYLMHIRKDAERSVAKLELTEREAEEALEGIVTDKRGISYTQDWNVKIQEIVDKAHESLDKPQE
ncbi:MAG: TlyA family RNA methyltransferase [Lachnospiraceae bacterium]|nr:TlyA family RNA methyltransferase [Lachnospiraceae bacterium]